MGRHGSSFVLEEGRGAKTGNHRKERLGLFYRHFKGNLYMATGFAKHSESLDEHIVYRRIGSSEWWIRPRKMFEENEPSGQRRFLPLDIAYEVKTLWDDEPSLKDIAALSEGVLDKISVESLREKLRHQESVSISTARLDDGRLLGFKIGYARSKHRYYSWLGMVAPEWRGGGIATNLTAAQHAWIAARGYTEVEIRTMERYPAMVALCLKTGFRWERLTDDHPSKIVFVKQLG